MNSRNTNKKVVAKLYGYCLPLFEEIARVEDGEIPYSLFIIIKYGEYGKR